MSSAAFASQAMSFSADSTCQTIREGSSPATSLSLSGWSFNRRRAAAASRGRVPFSTRLRTAAGSSSRPRRLLTWDWLHPTRSATARCDSPRSTRALKPPGLVEGLELGALEVLDDGQLEAGLVVRGRPHQAGDLVEAGELRGGQAAVPGHDGEAGAGARLDDQRLDDPDGADGRDQALEVAELAARVAPGHEGAEGQGAQRRVPGAEAVRWSFYRKGRRGVSGLGLGPESGAEAGGGVVGTGAAGAAALVVVAHGAVGGDVLLAPGGGGGAHDAPSARGSSRSSMRSTVTK
jgi:hypothetical protein